MPDKTRLPIAVFQKMRRLTTADNATPIDQRIKFLKALRAGIFANQAALKSALDADFNGRSAHETLLADIMPTIGAIDYSLGHLRKWMRPQKRHVAMHFLPAKNRVELVPKGVVLIISPWNYPVSLSILPMVSALAAGNRVILKPSEYTPRTSNIIAQLVADALPCDRATVLTGGAEVSQQLCALPFDHILFTGSGETGRKVMAAAAQNLTPVTLELGGKSPAIIHPDYDLAKAVGRIVRGKLINAGQTCIAPDYVMVAANRINEFVDLYKQTVERFYPQIAENPDYSAIINKTHFQRLNGLLDDAEQKGARVLALGAKKTRHSGDRKLHPHLVLDVKDSMNIASQEIFGPVLPVIPFEKVEQASSYINQRPRPLALYYFDQNSARVKKFLGATISGTAAINDTVLQFVQDDLPFGGTGPSGMGKCHGAEGFREFSHARSVFYQARLNSSVLLDPPYGRIFDKITRFLVR